MKQKMIENLLRSCDFPEFLGISRHLRAFNTHLSFPSHPSRIKPRMFECKFINQLNYDYGKTQF